MQDGQLRLVLPQRLPQRLARLGSPEDPQVNLLNSRDYCYTSSKSFGLGMSNSTSMASLHHHDSCMFSINADIWD